MSSRMSPSAWPRSTSWRSGSTSPRSNWSGRSAAARGRARTKRLPDVDEGAHGTGDALLGRHLVDPRRCQPRVDVAHRGLRQLVEQGSRGWGSSGRPWPGRRRRPRRRRSCSPARPARRTGAPRRRGSRRRRAAATAGLGDGSGIVVSVTISHFRLTRHGCLT